jgi:hypothetical protein
MDERAEFSEDIGKNIPGKNMNLMFLPKIFLPIQPLACPFEAELCSKDTRGVPTLVVSSSLNQRRRGQILVFAKSPYPHKADETQSERDLESGVHGTRPARRVAEWAILEAVPSSKFKVRCQVSRAKCQVVGDADGRGRKGVTDNSGFCWP